MPKVDLSSYVMTVEKYAKLEHETPYVFELAKGDRALFYFGSRHTNNPSSSALSGLSEYFVRFEPELAFIEGVPQINVLSSIQIREYTQGYSAEDLVRKMGEKGLITKLAVESNCSLHSPEPDDAAAVMFLEGEGYTRDEIFMQQVADQIPQFARQSLEQNFEKYMQPYFERMRTGFGWVGYDFSVGHFSSLQRELLGYGLDLDTIDLYVELSDPIPWPHKRIPYGRINMVAATWNGYRDRVIVQSVLEQFKTYNRIFIIYGASHAVMQESALRKMFESF